MNTNNFEAHRNQIKPLLTASKIIDVSRRVYSVEQLGRK